MTRPWVYFLVLLLLGAGWGLTQPMTKTAVSTGHQHFGLIFWQMAVTTLALVLMNGTRGLSLPLGRGHLLRYILIALIGTIIPNTITYQAAVHLPSGVLSIIIALVPMFALPLALLIGMEKFSLSRFAGLLCGAVAIVMIAAPETSLPEPGMAFWVLILALSPFLYAAEGTWVARYGILDLQPGQLLLGASAVGLVLSLPLAVWSGQFIDPRMAWGVPEFALIGSSVIHALVYTGYVWLVGRAGSVFASQVSYFVTGTGILWAMLLLGECYSLWIWAALALMLVGMFLVQPRQSDGLVTPPRSGDNGDVYFQG